MCFVNWSFETQALIVPCFALLVHALQRNMAVGKSKRVVKKGAKKKTGDFMLKKEWYNLRAPSFFGNRDVGKTLVNRTQGTRIAADGLKERVFEVSVADLENDSDDKSFRKFRLVAEDVQGRDVLLNFHGLTFTSDKLRSLVKKWHTLIEAITDVKTTDGYTLRIFVIAFTKKNRDQIKKTAYAQGSQVRKIRSKIVDIVTNEVNTVDLKTVVSKLKSESISKDIEGAAAKIFPVQNVHIRKVKVLKKPKFDIARLLEVHNTTAVAGTAVDRAADFVEPAPLAAV
eukprot:m.24350 g.24350  ORF g.24350 m.24350 type:complete len:285 (-) comp36086_c0_seq1:51-905(-)